MTHRADRTPVSVTFAICPDCDSRLEWDRTAPILFRCVCEDDEGLAPVDVYVEWNEVWVCEPVGERIFLAVLLYDIDENEVQW